MRDLLLIVTLVAALAVGLALNSVATSSAGGVSPEGEFPFVPVQPKPWNRYTECFLDRHWGSNSTVVAEWTCQTAPGRQEFAERQLPKPPEPSSGPPRVTPPPGPALAPSPAPVPRTPRLVPFWLGPLPAGR